MSEIIEQYSAEDLLAAQELMAEDPSAAEQIATMPDGANILSGVVERNEALADNNSAEMSAEAARAKVKKAMAVNSGTWQNPNNK